MTGSYSAPMDALAFTTATDVFEMTAPATCRLEVMEMDLCQTTDLGDAAEEVLRIGVYRGATAGATGTALTEQPYVDSNDGAARVAVVANRGTASTGGTLLSIIGWNIRIPMEKIWIPELRPIAELSTVLTFRLLTAPADSITVSGTIIWREM
jgi:hypothetical protein